MTDQSTRKIFDLMGIRTKKTSHTTHAQEIDENETFAVPQLQQVAEMEHILANILGSTSTKKHTPMD